MVKKVKEKKKLEKGGFSWKNFSLSGRISSILCISMVVVFFNECGYFRGCRPKM